MVARSKTTTIAQRPPGECPVASRPSLLTVQQAAEQLGISERKLWELLASKAIPKVKIGRAARIDPLDLAKWIEAAKAN